jgi:MoaA/NifB/PqqE/SkfB family radical SAM enzyme
MGGEPLLRPQFAQKVVYYAAKKGFWIYIGTNARLLRPDVADRLADAGVAVFNVAVDAWDVKPALPRLWFQSSRIWNASCGSSICTATWFS